MLRQRNCWAGLASVPGPRASHQLSFFFFMVFGFSLTWQSFFFFFFKYSVFLFLLFVCLYFVCLSLGTNPTSYKSRVHVTVSRTYVECVCTCEQRAMDRVVRYFEWFQWLRARTETLCLGLAKVYGLLLRRVRRLSPPLVTASFSVINLFFCAKYLHGACNAHLCIKDRICLKSCLKLTLFHKSP